MDNKTIIKVAEPVTSSFKKTWLKGMVTGMKYMTRYAGFVTRPLVSLYAEHEVIACGLRTKQGRVRIIYTPRLDRGKHEFFKENGGNWEPMRTLVKERYSGPLVHQVEVQQPRSGEIYQVWTRKCAGNEPNGKLVKSPKITVKKETKYQPALIGLKKNPDGGMAFRWPRAGRYNPMIYFLVVENEFDRALVGIYTRENIWRYPRVKDASLSLLTRELKDLEKNKEYKARLLLVDYDGWVSHIAEKSFVY